MLEQTIGAAAAEEYGWEIANGEWVKDHDCALAATLDFRICQPEAAVLETKNVDWLQHRRVWGSEPPIYIQLQHQAQLACTGESKGYVVALVGGNHLERYEFAARPKIIADMRRRVHEFWKSIEEGREPPIDGSDSTAAAVRAMFPEAVPGKEIDLSGDNEAGDRIARLKQATMDRLAGEKAEAAHTNWIMAKIGDAELVRSDGQIVATCKTVKRKAFAVEASQNRQLRLKETA
jgi:predicted phage-related endonuclease